MSFGFSLADLRRHIGDDDEGEISAASASGIGGTSADTDTPVPSSGDIGMQKVSRGRRKKGDGGFHNPSGQMRGERLKDFRNWQKALQNAKSAEEVKEINRRRAAGIFDYNITQPPPKGVDETPVPNQNRDSLSIENGVDIEDDRDDSSSGGGGGSDGDEVEVVIGSGGTVTLNPTGELTTGGEGGEGGEGASGKVLKLIFKNGLFVRAEGAAISIGATGHLETATCGDDDDEHSQPTGTT